MDKITVTTIPNAPAFAHGLVRDLRVRWALEEAGLGYAVEAALDRNSDAYRRRQPFGMIPAFEADGLEMFESGAIVHVIAEESEILAPTGRAGRAATLMWSFAALNTVEPPIWELFLLDVAHKDEPWAPLRRPGAVEVVRSRLASLAAALTGRDYLTGRFSVADILMTTTLRFLRHTDLVAEFPVLDAYLKRCEARPALKKALADQLAEYARHEAVAA